MLIVLTFVVLADFNYPDFFKEDRDTPLLEILVLRGRSELGIFPMQVRNLITLSCVLHNIFHNSFIN